MWKVNEVCTRMFPFFYIIFSISLTVSYLFLYSDGFRGLSLSCLSDLGFQFFNYSSHTEIFFSLFSKPVGLCLKCFSSFRGCLLKNISNICLLCSVTGKSLTSLCGYAPHSMVGTHSHPGHHTRSPGSEDVCWSSAWAQSLPTVTVWTFLDA